MAKVPQIILDIDGAGPIIARVEFNKVFLAQNNFTTPERRAMRINGWVVNGVNHLQVRLVAATPAVPPKPEQALAAEPELPPPPPPPVVGKFSLKLREALADRAPEDDPVLVDYQWSPSEQPLIGNTPIVALSEDIKLKSAFTWLWTTGAPVAQLSTGDQRDISGLLQALHSALTNKAIPDLLRIQAIQVQEQAVAIGEDGEKMLQEYAKFLQERMGQPDWEVLPIDWEQLRPVRMGDGRIHRIDHANGEAPIVTTAGGSIFAIQPYLAKVEHRWLVMR